LEIPPFDPSTLLGVVSEVEPPKAGKERCKMKKHFVILVILFMGLFGSPIPLFSQTSKPTTPKMPSPKFIIYYGEKETGFENWSISTSEGKIRLIDSAQFKLGEMDFMINMDLILDTLLFPQKLDMDGKVLGQVYKVSTEFSGGKAINLMNKEGRDTTIEVPVHKDALVLPNGLFYPYTFLVKRYDFKKGGKQDFFGYVVPVETPISIEDKGKEKVDFETGPSELQKFFVNLAGMVGINLWVDKNEQIIKLTIPMQGIEVYQEGYKPAPQKAEIDTLTKNYTSEDTTFKSGDLKLAGTVTVPQNGEKKHPACIIISGSGPLDRDGKVQNLGFSVQYKAIAHTLSNSGILVLRYDKKGVGRSEGDFKTASLSDLVSDAKAGIMYLKSRKDVDTSRICLIGHSEGAIIAPMIAAEDKSIKAIVLMAGTAKPLDQVLIEQQGFLLSQAKIPDEMKEKAMEEQQEFFDWVRGKKEWKEEEMPPQYKELMGQRKWFLEHFEHDPLQTIARVKCKVLILQGQKDKQVFDIHAIMLSNALNRAGNENHQVKLFPDLDHFFCKTEGEGDYAEYAKTERPIDPEFLNFLTDWLKKEL
jgi:alpha/beta superfamily hydrolase